MKEGALSPEGALGQAEGEGQVLEGPLRFQRSRGPQNSWEVSQAGVAGSWKPSVPGKERGSAGLPRSLTGNKNLGGGQDSPTQPGKMKPFCLGSCSWRCQKPSRPGPWTPLGL